jgi:hypothetical protein
VDTGGMGIVARISSIIVSLVALAALCAAAIVAMRMTGPGWRNFVSGISRLIRSQEDHPNWEVLMQ